MLNNADQPVVLLDPKAAGELEDRACFACQTRDRQSADPLLWCLAAVEPAGHQIDWLAHCERRTNTSHRTGAVDGDLGQGPLVAVRALRAGTTFVQDVGGSSDPCANPNVSCPHPVPPKLERGLNRFPLQLLEQHGFYLQDTGGPNPDLLPLTRASLTPTARLSPCEKRLTRDKLIPSTAMADRQLLPIISLSSTPRHSDLLGVPVGIEGWIEHVGSQDVDWQEKVDQVYWVRPRPILSRRSADTLTLTSYWTAARLRDRHVQPRRPRV